MKIEDKSAGISGDFKRLDSTPPEGATARSIMTLEATVEVNPQALQSIRPYRVACLRIPPGMPPLGQFIMSLLFACFDKQKSVKEGILGDMIFGFQASGVPPEKTLAGLDILHRAGYIKFQAPEPDNNFIDFTSDKVIAAWVRYQPSFLEMVYEAAS